MAGRIPMSRWMRLCSLPSVSDRHLPPSPNYAPSCSAGCQDRGLKEAKRGFESRVGTAAGGWCSFSLGRRCEEREETPFNTCVHRSPLPSSRARLISHAHVSQSPWPIITRSCQSYLHFQAAFPCIVLHPAPASAVSIALTWPLILQPSSVSTMP